MDEEGAMEIPPHMDQRNSKKAEKTDHPADQPATDPSSSKSVANKATTTTVPPSETDDLVAHPYANLFPKMPKSDLEKLAASINNDGLNEAIVTYEGKILDGCNRYAACKEADVKPDFVEYDGTDPMAYVLRKNLYRRNLSASQKGMTAARLATLTRGGDRRSEDFKGSIGGLKIENAAELVGVSEKTINRAKTVLSRGSPELIEAVDNGDLTVFKAENALDEPKEPVVLTREQESQRLIKLWDNTGEEGRALFLKHINRDDVPQIPDA
jgi:ParB-like chromosome segregation protein Spo0J